MTGKGDGLYSCCYTPAAPIKHTLALTWGGVSIPKSPFRVSSQSQPPVSAGAPRAAPLGSAADAEPDFLFKAKRIEIVSPDRAKTVQARSKKPLIIIMTTEERYSF